MTVDARAALLGELVDYAGLFPPASLELDAALEAYDRHLRGDHAPMLGRFVLPAARLDELAPWLDGPWSPDRPLRLSLLCSPEVLERMAAFLRATPAVRGEALELRQPTGREPGPWLDELLAELERTGLVDVDAYIELDAETDAEQLLALGERQQGHPLQRLGAKLRCGGVTADLVPPLERVAAVIALARDEGVPLKFTAGLHHPLRGMDHTGSVPMHGFLNVYGAALLAHAENLSPGALVPVLAETDPGTFRLDEDGFAWRGHAVAAARLGELRRELLGGYGSCSFDEPVTDLQKLSLLA